MSKERLEELKKMRLLYEVCFVDEYASAIDDVTADFDLLIKRVQELEEAIADYAYEIGKRKRALNKKNEQNNRYREALEFYANKKTYRYYKESYIDLLKDGGYIARKALEDE